MSNLIDRQQAIEAICMETCGVSLKNERCMVHCTEVQAVEKLPPAEPMVDIRDTQYNLPVGTDTISRQAAIDIVQGYAEQLQGYIGMPNDSEVYAYARGLLLSIDRNIKALQYAQPEQLSTNLAEVGTDCINRQAAIDAVMECYDNDELFEVYEDKLRELPPAQPERTCVNCGRTANNGGWYADGRTRCPIEEHYALPKDGYCHLWEKRNVTDDDYPERRTDE